jgi:hypothetical protein
MLGLFSATVKLGLNFRMSIEPSKLEASEHDAESVSQDWAPEEERRARLK